ncbi:MAG: hypothetical protein QNJ98_12995 [Planctomycetota bacterium]|nr:hypothetical protein [Planctomycetota bacterium]
MRRLVALAALLALFATPTPAVASKAEAQPEAPSLDAEARALLFAPILAREKVMDVLAKASARRDSPTAALEALDRALARGTQALDRLGRVLEGNRDAQTLLEGERMKRRIVRRMVGIRIQRAELYAARPAMKNAHKELAAAQDLAGDKPELVDARANLREQEERQEQNYERDRRRDRSVNGAGFEGRRGGRFGNDRRGLLGR